MPPKPDAVRISKTIAFLLRHRPEVGGLTPDEHGFVMLVDLAVAVSKLMRTDVLAAQITVVVEQARSRRFEIQGEQIRALDRSRGRPSAIPPDICYHATSDKYVNRYLEKKTISTNRGRPVYLSQDESQAWRAAHRMGGKPRVLYVDTSRARRHGVRFFRDKRSGLYHADAIPVNDVLNLRPNFAEQLSAGGIPIKIGADGVPRMALIKVTRRSGVTWEVAKGKLEHGETPESAAVREVGEEMGIDVPMEVTDTVGIIRYGFMAPGGLPRLKTVFLYLLNPLEPIEDDFRPANAEGIGEVAWFTTTEAVRAVRHSSLIPLMKRARRMVDRTHADT
ncbi:MAG: NUDIX domain-containing protein [Rhodobacterales bacterium]|nr:NUDIX domain-containing protein [Rhodobacterales bacterium]